ncbi:hypothetical protein [Burkholderia metallica]|uniref:hypothetical protein n=1 Tax=Burkholderia metallica TaxID=488729 RepID=UPI00131B11A8|nr:hypothetical protein [Burkholderia metallica]
MYGTDRRDDPVGRNRTIVAASAAVSTLTQKESAIDDERHAHQGFRRYPRGLPPGRAPKMFQK